jgi:hypothetical protein
MLHCALTSCVPKSSSRKASQQSQSQQIPHARIRAVPRSVRPAVARTFLSRRRTLVPRVSPCVRPATGNKTPHHVELSPNAKTGVSSHSAAAATRQKTHQQPLRGAPGLSRRQQMSCCLDCNSAAGRRVSAIPVSGQILVRLRRINSISAVGAVSASGSTTYLRPPAQAA